jgi:regulator of ribonuclease activity A
MSFKTADLSDVHSDHLKVADNIFKSYGKLPKFHGAIVTVKVFEDNVLVKSELEKDGTGKVLVVDGGGSLRCALMGDNVAALIEKNNWNGVLIYGAIRDSADINEMNIAVKALGTHPFKSIKKGLGEVNIPVHFAGMVFKPGEFIYSDEDGIIVSEKKLI